MNNACHQSGLSMIELLVALAISSFLILGITQIYVDNKQNYSFQQAQSENLENGRFTLLLIEQQLSKTGYRRRPDVDPFDSFKAVNDSTGSKRTDCSFLAGQVINRINAQKICIRYEPRDPEELNCSGNGLNATQKAAIAKAYTIPSSPLSYIEKYTLEENSNGETKLLCNAAIASGTTISSQSGDVEIVEGISDIRYEFGVDTNNDKIADSFESAPSATAANQSIVSVRYSVLAHSQKNVSQGMSSKAFTKWHENEESPLSEPTEGRLYHIAESTFTLRNLMP